jgi:xylulokinase
LTASHSRADLTRAVLEGVSYSQKDCLDIIEGMGVRADSARLSGGGARSPFWRQMLADVFDRRAAVLETEEGSAYGAALLALVMTREFSSVQEVCRAVIRETAHVAPDPERARAYRRGHQLYRSLYPALRDFYRSLDSGMN